MKCKAGVLISLRINVTFAGMSMPNKHQDTVTTSISKMHPSHSEGGQLNPLRSRGMVHIAGSLLGATVMVQALRSHARMVCLYPKNPSFA